jgi:hypothetical protein
MFLSIYIYIYIGGGSWILVCVLGQDWIVSDFGWIIVAIWWFKELDESFGYEVHSASLQHIC